MALCKRLTVDANGKHGDEPGFDKDNVAIYGASIDQWYTYERFYNSSFWRDLPSPPHNNAVFVDSFAYGTTPPRLPFYSTGEFRQSVTDGMAAITLGKATSPDVVANVDQVLNKYLQNQKKA